MNNYQLYRTNVLLGGQMKYDLVLNSDSDNHTSISDIHISPISKSVPYGIHIEDNILNCSHSENIKNFYKKTENYFYDDFANPALNNIYPLPETYSGETSETTYEMGCRRMKYHLYNKQFEFLCPVWLEHIEDIRDLKFHIDIYTGTHDIQIEPLEEYGEKDPDYSVYIPTNKHHLISRTIEFDQLKMIEYFNNYIKQLGLDKGCDWVFDINKDRSVLTGLNVSTGQCENIELLKFCKDLISTERPLLEFNNIIINTINNNHMITKQLFNFNLCFNLEDILNQFLIRELNNQYLNIEINISIKDQLLMCKDIFSNHTNIIKPYLNLPIIKYDNYTNDILVFDDEHLKNEYNSTQYSNVLEYLNDYNCIDLIDKNKILQNTCHWCYSADPQNSTFNMYDGFSLLSKNKNNEILNIPYYNGEKLYATPAFDNYICYYPFWCNNYSIGTPDNISNVLPFFIKNKDHLFSKFSSNCVVKGVNYKTKKTYDDILVTVLHIDNPIAVGGDYFLEEIEQNVKRVIYDYPGWEYGYVGIGQIEDGPEKEEALNKSSKDALFLIPFNQLKYGRKIIFICQGLRKMLNDPTLSYSYYYNLIYDKLIENLKNLVGEKKTNNQIIKEFLDILNSRNDQYNQIINFNKSLYDIRADGPSLSSKEIHYYKRNADKVIIRSFGKVKPYFISENDIYFYNLRYNKKYAKDLSNQYHQYSNTGYSPKYPSIGYFALDNKKEDYIIIPQQISNNIEYHHYKNNRIFYLQPTISCRFNIENEIDINQEIKRQIENIYGDVLKSIFTNNYENNLNYITNQYNLAHTDIEYVDGTFIYDIQIKLK